MRNLIAAAFAIFMAGGSGGGGGTYTGLIDQFPTLGVTWGFSVYKLSSAYAGNFATIQRQSDSTTTTVGFTNGLATASTLTSFCSGTICYATTVYDQSGNGNNAICTNVRAFIATDGRVALSPQAGGKCVVAYASAYSTAKQEFFAVAAPMFQDNRPYQAGIATVSTTGNVTSGSGTITSIGSSAGISAANNLYGQPAVPGVQDSANCLAGSGSNAGATYFTAISTTATLSFEPGTASPVCSQTGDTLTFSNAVIGGAWVSQGPNAAFSSAYWGFGISVNSVDGYAADSTMIVNGTATSSSVNNNGSSAGQYMRQTMAVWDFDTYTGKIFYDGTQISNGLGASANVTYSTNVGLTLFEAANGSDQLQQAVFESFVLINQTASNRATVASWLMSQSSLTAPLTSYTDANGFVYKPELLGPYPPYPNAYGDYTVTDLNSITWAPQSGGYYGSSGPSVAYATNINNSATMWRFVDQPGDSDIAITQAERAEVSSTTATIAPGQSASMFSQFRFDAYTSQTGDWCYINQVHYDDNLQTSAPDIFALDCKSGTLQSIYQKGSTTTNCGSAVSIVQGTTYALQVEITWSSSHTADALAVWLGTNGGTLTQVCSASGSLFPNDTGAYMKLGIYRGYPYSNSGTLVLNEMNAKWSNTANAFSAYRTSQPALPTHP